MKTKNVNQKVSEPVEAKVAGVMDMLEEEFHVLTAIEQGKVIGGSGGTGSGGGGYGSGGGMGSGGPGCGPFSSGQLNFIKTAEGYVDHVEWDELGGCYTVGYGHQLSPSEVEQYQNGDFDVSQSHLNQLFGQDVAEARSEVNDVVTNPNITDDMYLALTDLVFNAGTSDFDDSNMVDDINNGDFASASNEFEHWNADQIPGLDTRRANEQNMFDTYSTGVDDYSYQSGIHTGYWSQNH